MLIFPAIDLVQGKAVRLYKGDYARMTVYSEDPPALARDFYNAGAKCLHLVDLEGAKTGQTPNLDTVRAIRQAADEVGMDKLMWGSDYPRTITAITYRMSCDFILKSPELSPEDKAAFLGGNARSFYGFRNLPELPYIKNMSE